MPRLSRPVLTLLVLACVGCAAATPAVVKPAGGEARAGGKAARRADAGVPQGLRLSGQVLAPGAALISDRGAGIVSKNGGTVISNNGASYRLAAVALEPVAGARVQVVNPAGDPVGQPVVADADGRWYLPVTLPAGEVFLVRATFQRAGRDLALAAAFVPETSQADLTLDVEPAATVVAQKVATARAAGALDPMAVTTADLGAIADQVRGVLDDDGAVAAGLLAPAATAAAFDALVARTPALASTIEAALGADAAPLLAPGATPGPGLSPGGTGTGTGGGLVSSNGGAITSGPGSGGLVAGGTPAPGTPAAGGGTIAISSPGGGLISGGGGTPTASPAPSATPGELPRGERVEVIHPAVAAAMASPFVAGRSWVYDLAVKLATFSLPGTRTLTVETVAAGVATLRVVDEVDFSKFPIGSPGKQRHELAVPIDLAAAGDPYVVVEAAMAELPMPEGAEEPFYYLAAAQPITGVDGTVLATADVVTRLDLAKVGPDETLTCDFRRAAGRGLVYGTVETTRRLTPWVTRVAGMEAFATTGMKTTYWLKSGPTP
jgi:hypothetical protein